MSNVGLEKVPKCIGHFHNLKRLDFFGNKVSTIPKDCLPPSLTDINFRRNLITDVDLSNLTKIHYISLSHNHLKSLDLRNAGKLYYLFVYNN